MDGVSGEKRGPGSLAPSRSMPHRGQDPLPQAKAQPQQQPQQQQQPQPQQQQVWYNSVEDFSGRVEIYRGRHSVVWNVVCRQTRRPLILKGYMKAKMTERNFHQVRREIRLMQYIQYDGAVKLHGTFEDGAAIYLVQEICAKGDLFKKLIRSGGTLEEPYVAGEVILPLLMTLQHLHARKVFHRDIKPENIFFMKDGYMKLGDFGLAIDAAIERPKSRVGTLDYMSPEVVSLPTADERRRLEQQGKAVQEQVYTEKVDIWAVGVLAYELIVGKPPFEVDDESETRRRIMYETTLTFPPRVSPDAVSFVRAALAKNASLRPGAAELLHHPWLRPHLSAALAGASGGGAVAELRRGGAVAAAAAVGRSASFSAFGVAAAAGAAGAGAAAGAIGTHRPAGLTIPAADEPGGALSFSGPFRGCGGGGGGGGAYGGLASGGAPAAGCASAGAGAGRGGARAPPSPAAGTPGPYQGGRKPVWEADRLPSGAFTSVRTSGLQPDGQLPSPPAAAPARSKLAVGPGALAASGGGAGGGGSFSGGANQLLKAALSSSLAKAAHPTASAAGGGGGAGAAAAAAAHAGGGGGGSGGGARAAANVKLRIKEYFVARSANEAGGGGGGGTLT
ncbi:aurora protein [Raphidocelis subcapitata]|uniref:Aurora protein n=1 Tax=Raphidocelis subcapitata TaxID=307507 RepID=A0A2V0PAD9_9CHLO|nr:aurora protein [Raphidocelis subcapitata]|eukprot:GBF94873.1 aurora protein [Raphidocelis subcapitata]